ncbi:MAG: hypothetical protein FJX75_16685 [Armatimonadetes bacterium]|nr:hypothetical protein [Armatimonadota bacterium]
MLPAERIDCSEILLRAVRKRNWDPSQEGVLRIRPDEFMRRPDHPESGLSVFRRSLVSPQQCIERARGPIPAVASLHTGRVRDVDGLNLTVMGTDEGGHATILGVADPSEDRDEALRQGVVLRSICRLVWVREGR